MVSSFIAKNKITIVFLFVLTTLYFASRLTNLLSLPIFTDEAIYMWWAQTYTEADGGGGSLPWIRSIITSDNRSAEDEVHELAHAWETAKVAEGLWTPQSFTRDVWNLAVNSWPNQADRDWVWDFKDDPLSIDPEGYNETYASTASRVMGDLGLLAPALVPYYAPLFTR